MSTPPTFIVGTGRCGSTLLSKIVLEHPSILSISEFFCLCSDYGGCTDALFLNTPVDGEYLWGCIAGVRPRADIMVKNGVTMSEVLYPYDDPGSRFDRETGVPQVLQATLPHLTDDFDALFDELKPYVLGLEESPIRTQYERLFDWLRDRFGKKLWVERSGASFSMMEGIDRTFPDARYVHIVRDGRDTALSMSRHPGFKMVVIGEYTKAVMGVDPYYSDDREKVHKLPRKYRELLPECFDPDAFEKLEIPPHMAARVWSDQIVRGLAVLDRIPKERLLTIRFEDLLAEPRPVLERFAAFLGDDCPQDDWLNRVAGLVGSPRSSWKKLAANQQRVLRRMCAPGFEALAAHGIRYSDCLDRAA